MEKITDALLTFCGLSIGAYLGDYFRLGISYYRIWRIETNYTVMYAQIIGCFIMGLLTSHKNWFHSASRVRRILYISATTGFCGCITTFSAWEYECNKNFFLQWDLSWGNDIGSFNGGRIFEWVVCLWTGVVLPLSAYCGGQHLSALSKWNNKKISKDDDDKKHEDADRTTIDMILELTLIACFIAATVVAVVPPATTGWAHLAWASFFSVIGAYLRYLLAITLNPRFPTFPLGTFIANVLGSWLLAAFITIAKYGVNYSNHGALGVLYGLCTGLTGSLTTVSTMIAEIDALKPKAKWRYAFWSIFISQIGFILLLNIFAFTQVNKDSVMPPPIDFCTTYEELCTKLLDHLDCPEEYRGVYACDKMPKHGYDPGWAASTWNGNCTCGAFYATERIAELIVDSQSRNNMTLIPMWPTKDDRYYEASEPAETVEYCLSYESMCENWLNRIGCPHEIRSIRGCGRHGDGGIEDFQGVCNCGDFSEIPSTRVSEEMIDALLVRRKDLYPYRMFAADRYNPIDYCEAFTVVCQKLLDHAQCPLEYRKVKSCKGISDYENFEGVCSCESSDGAYSDGDERVGENIYDVIVKQVWVAEMVIPDHSKPGHFDACASYSKMCDVFLTQIGCPKHLYQNDSPCGKGKKKSIKDWIEVSDEVVVCSCGGIDVSSERTRELVIDASLARDYTNMKYIPVPVAPYTLQAMSNPFRILMQPGDAPLPM